ncbi:aquaporin [Blastopirellula marina]|uniref:Aquaporin n=1 Tax=Blastopirellula marina TaxID=124 RepID=A0A2S8FFS5_9BACT|nr:aquaporin [Blastopirellula marina]RCS50911.1 MIP family channel protein [Bremerella cremea]
MPTVRRYVAEVIGTFALIFAGTGAVVVNDMTQESITHVGIALTWGMIVMALIYALGDISGAHLNPAVTIGFWTARQFDGKQVVPYIVAQLIGAITASVTLRVLFLEHDTLGATIPAGPWWQSFVLEVILTFLLMFIVLNVATGAKEKGIMAGAAIGATVGLEAMFAGPICGASMNPARSIAPALVSGHLEHLWIYIVATTAGAILAVFAYQFVHSETSSGADAASEHHTVEEGS